MNKTIEEPVITAVSNNAIETLIEQLIISTGENPHRDGLQKTPKRAREALQYLTKGYHENLAELVNGAIYESDMDEMVIVRDIELYSLCEHHLLPFIGKCHIAYIPNGKILGLSKIARVVEMFARRLQIQEHLTKQIAEAILAVTEAKGVSVIIEAQHLCMMMRGVEKQNSKMTTSVMLGLFRKDDRTRAEFLNLIKN
jgi:GTP cyclohydrolase I